MPFPVCNTSVAAQVDCFAGAVGELKPGDLPPVLDVEEARNQAGEDTWNTIAPDGRVPLVVEWLELAEQRLGMRPILYVRRSYVAEAWPNPEPLAAYFLWVAHFTSQPTPAFPSVWPKWTFWQYSDKGRIQGINGAVDLDRFNGSAAELRALTKEVPMAAQAAVHQ